MMDVVIRKQHVSDKVIETHKAGHTHPHTHMNQDELKHIKKYSGCTKIPHKSIKADKTPSILPVTLPRLRERALGD